MNFNMTDDGSFIKHLFRKQSTINILVLILSTIGPAVCMILAGSIFGSEGLAIMAICAPLFILAAFFGFTISGGGQILCTEYIAKDDTKNVDKVFSAVCILTVGIGVIISAALFLFKEPILLIMTDYISPQLSAFYRYFVLNAFFTMIMCIPMFFSRIIGRMDIGLVLMGASAVVSIGASLIFANFMGIEAFAAGQALGTFVGTFAAMVMTLRHFSFKFTKSLHLKKIFTYGSPSGLGRLYVLIATTVLNALFSRAGGVEALAVWGVISMLHRFGSSIIGGISQTIVPITAVFHEEQDIASIRQTMKSAFIYGNVLMLIAGAIFIVFSAQIARLFGLDDPSMLSVAMPLYALYGLLLASTTIFSAYYNAVKKLTLANIVPFLQEFAMLVACAFALEFAFGINGIWASLPLSSVLTMLALVATLLIMRNRDASFWLLQNRRLESEGRYISFSVECDAMKASEAAANVNEFCENNNVPPEQANLISLSVEEIITLIASNCKHRKSARGITTSVRLFLLDDMKILRIRNAGSKFDALEYYKENIADDIEKSIEVAGMKYIDQSARNVYYRQTFGVNNLVVTL